VSVEPKVTIIIPCYNSESFVEESVMSGLAQDYPNIEVIAVDNESTDSTVNILTNLSKENKDLVLSTAKNIYPNCWDEARAEGFRLMTGQYATVIGSDDIIHPSYISNCMKIIQKAPDKIKVFAESREGVPGREREQSRDWRIKNFV
jgi:glycosyltransferase involved in cell wall biosynthesis